MNPSEKTLQPLSVGARDAAKLIGVSERTVAEQVAKNAIPSFKLGGRRLFSVKALTEWVDRMSEPTPSESPESEAGHVE